MIPLPVLARLCLCCAIAMCCLTGSPAVAQQNIPVARFTGARTAPQGPNEYAMWLTYWSPSRAWYNIPVEDTPWRLDFFGTGAGTMGLYGNGTPYFAMGPHMIERFPGGREAYYTAYLESIRIFVERELPPNYSGMFAIDAEFWSPFWTGHPNQTSTEGPTANDWDQLDDWRDYIRESRADQLAGLTPEQQEEIFRQTWLTATRDFYTRVFQRVKSLRPNAKVGFYNLPLQSYHEWRNPVIAARWRWAYENEMGWLWDMVDAIFPSVYPFYQSVPDGSTVPRGYFDRQSDFEQYLRDNIGEAIRHASGKPVVAYIAYQFHPSNPNQGWAPITPWMMRRSFEIPRELGCAGAVLFGFPQSQQNFEASVPFFRDVINPIVRELAALPSLAPVLNPPPLSAPSVPTSGGSGTPPTPPAPPPAPSVPPTVSPAPAEGGGNVLLPHNPLSGLPQPPLPPATGGTPNPAAVAGDAAGAKSAKPVLAATSKSKSATSTQDRQGVQTLRPTDAAAIDFSAPPIVLAEGSHVGFDQSDVYAEAVSRARGAAAGSPTSRGTPDAIAAALARQQSGVFGVSAPTIVYQSSKPKPTIAPNKDKVITSVPTP